MKYEFKRLFSVLLIVAMLFTQTSVTIAEDMTTDAVIGYYDDYEFVSTEYEGLMWCYDQVNGELVVTGSGEMPDFTDITRPWEKCASSARSVTIVGDLTSVGSYAFSRFYNLNTLRFIADIKIIHSNAFESCEKLRMLHLPYSIEVIDECAFPYTGLISVYYEGDDFSKVNIANNIFNSVGLNRHRGANLVKIDNVKTVYSYGEEFYAEVSMCNSYGDFYEVKGYTVTGFNSTIPGTQTVTVRYASHIKRVKITVLEEGVVAPEPVVEIYIENVKKEYCIGEEFYAEVYEYVDGVQTQVPLYDCVIEGFDSSLSGWQSVTVYYQNYCETFEVCVYEDAGEANVVLSGTCGVDVNWTLDDSGLLRIYGSGDMDDYASDTGKPWYSAREDINRVVIEYGVTSIGEKAFNFLRNITSITIPDSVTKINKYAFYGCVALTDAIIPDSVITTGYGVFGSCESLENVVIGNSLTTIGGGMFSGCKMLTNIDIPASVNTIGERAFSYCDNLESINVNPKNRSYISVDGILFNRDKSVIIQYPTGKKDTSYVIPDSVTEIADAAFDVCTYLTNVTISDSVTKIGEYAFRGCNSLSKVTIPDSVTEIGGYSFADCNSLISMEIGGGLTTIPEYAFWACRNLITVTIGGNVTTIGKDAFWACYSLTNVILGTSVNTISEYAFWSCDKITDVYYLGTENEWKNVSVTKNGNDTFLNATMHFGETPDTEKDIIIFKNAKTEYECGEEFYVEVYVYTADGEYYQVEDYKVDGFDSYIIGNQTVTVSYGDYSETFEIYIYSLENISWIFDEKANELIIEGSGEMPEFDVVSPPWNEYFEQVQTITISGDLTTISNGAFEGFHNVESVNIIAPIEAILTDAFENCHSIQRIYIPDTVILIEQDAFRHCYDIMEIYYSGDRRMWNDMERYDEYLANADVIYEYEGYPEDETTIVGIEVELMNYDVQFGTEPKMHVYALTKAGELVEVEDYTISGFDSYIPGEQVVIVEYMGYTAEVVVNVVVEFELTIINAKTEYNIGEPFYAELRAVHESGKYVDVPLEECNISGFDNTMPGYQLVEIEFYGEIVTVEVTVSDENKPEFDGTVEVRNLKTEYELGEDFYAEVYVYTADGGCYQVEDYQLDGFDPWTEGYQVVTITYCGQRFEYEVYVNGKSVENHIESVELVYAKRAYYPGDEFYAELLVTYVDGTDEIVTDFEVEGFDSYTPCAQKVLIRYGEYELYTTVRVYPASEAPQISQLTFADLNTEYYIGDELQVEIIGVKEDGTYITINLADCEIEGFDNTTPGEQVVTVTYSGLSVEFAVTVYDVDEPDVPDVPEIPETVDFKYIKTEYEFGEGFYAEVYVIDANGEELAVDYYVEGFDIYMPGWQTVTVFYNDHSYTCDVYVNEQQPQIVDVKFNIQHDYSYGEEFSATAEVYYDDGTVKQVKDCEVEGYDAYEPGEQVVRVIYGEYSINVIVTVANEQPQVTVNYVKTEYEYGEDFYAEVQVSYKGEITNVYDYNVTGFDSYSPGVQKVTVSYLNYRKIFTVVVNEPAYVEPEIRPVVSVSSERCRAGNTVDVVISLSENTGFANLGLEISYDTAMTLVGVTANNNVGATFTKAQSFDVYPYNIGWDSVSNNDYNGELVTLTFEVPEDMCAGEYSVDVDFYKGRNGDYTDGVSVNYDENEKPLFLEYVSGCITVYDYIPGDINGDGTVTNKDGTALLRYLAGWELENIVEDALDVDGDGAVTNKDGTRLLRYLAGWNVEIY